MSRTLTFSEIKYNASGCENAKMRFSFKYQEKAQTEEAVLRNLKEAMACVEECFLVNNYHLAL